MINEVISWFENNKQVYIEESELGEEKTLLTIYNFQGHKIPAHVYIGSVGGLSILTLETQDLMTDINWSDIGLEERCNILEWMLKDNDRNSMGNWGICPFGRIRFQLELPVTQLGDIQNYMNVVQQVLSALGAELDVMRSIITAQSEAEMD